MGYRPEIATEITGCVTEAARICVGAFKMVSRTTSQIGVGCFAIKHVGGENRSVFRFVCSMLRVHSGREFLYIQSK
jgi:hypothetical protein